MIDVMVFITSCHVSENPKSGPVSSQTASIETAAIRAPVVPVQDVAAVDRASHRAPKLVVFPRIETSTVTIMDPIRELNVPAETHGRVLVSAPRREGPLRVLAGFHGYAQSADEMMEMLRGVPAEEWTLVAVQGLHRFYRGRSQLTVASWMTRQDREVLIADNVRYVDAAIARAAGGRAIARLICCGFSQGAGMAFRAGLLGARTADAVIGLGGDVPPELLDDARLAWPRVLLARGARDEWYTADKLRTDEVRLAARGARVETFTFEGAHGWERAFADRAALFLGD